MTTSEIVEGTTKPPYRSGYGTRSTPAKRVVPATSDPVPARTATPFAVQQDRHQVASTTEDGKDATELQCASIVHGC